MVDIIFSRDNGKIIKILPVVPAEIPINQSKNNEEFETINSGILNSIGQNGLKKITIDSFFPNNDYKWIKRGATTDGWTTIKTSRTCGKIFRKQ